MGFVCWVRKGLDGNDSKTDMVKDEEVYPYL